MKTLHELVLQQYYHRATWILCFYPLSLIYQVWMRVRRWLYTHQWLPYKQFDIPVWVIGNITVGGNGKTPFVIALAQTLAQKGYKPGIVCGGYKGQLRGHQAHLLSEHSTAKAYGDEAVLIYQKTSCPVVICKKRAHGVQKLINQGCDIILSDDGLQHLALKPDKTFIVINHNRKMGNGLCLPAGPLREPDSILSKADLIIYKMGTAPPMNNQMPGYCFYYTITSIYNCHNPEQTIDIQALKAHQDIIAATGLGDPQHFFQLLSHHGIAFTSKVFPNHHHWQQSDLQGCNQADNILLITEKDAVKCKHLDVQNLFVVAIDVHMSPALHQAMNHLIARCLPLL